jgi:hypothetical protein
VPPPAPPVFVSTSLHVDDASLAAHVLLDWVDNDTYQVRPRRVVVCYGCGH